MAAVKFDGGKAPVFTGAFQYFPAALMAVSYVSLFGFQKYGEWFGWKGVPDGPQRYSEALGRHIALENTPDVGDGANLIELLKGLGIQKPSVKLMHMAQASWNSLARLQFQVEQEQKTGEADAK